MSKCAMKGTSHSWFCKCFQEGMHRVLNVRLRRVTICQYSRIGCPWRGPFHERLEHERVCIHPHNTGAQVLEVLDAMEEKKKEERMLYDSLFDLLSCEKMLSHGKCIQPTNSRRIIIETFWQPLLPWLVPILLLRINRAWMSTSRLRTKRWSFWLRDSWLYLWDLDRLSILKIIAVNLDVRKIVSCKRLNRMIVFRWVPFIDEELVLNVYLSPWHECEIVERVRGKR